MLNMKATERMRPVAAVAIVLMALLPAGCGGRSHPAPLTQTPDVDTADDYDIHVYRGVDANLKTGKATLSPSQFRFNPELSTFARIDQSPSPKPCNYRFQVTGVAHDPPRRGDSGQVLGLPAGYIAYFNNDPAGHWGIRHPAGVTPEEAKQVVATYAQSNRGDVVNGTIHNCH